MYYVYIVECKDGTLYTGYTVNLEKRLISHNEGKGAKYTRGRIPVVLKYFEEHENKNDALKREIKIKSLRKNKKLELVNSFKNNIK
ncbi:MAG: GIY-YIG nuclease family protein [Tissierellia bacterium]|nr:GIY-YIG nuclease family protein [Tissierellia bacterium]